MAGFSDESLLLEFVTESKEHLCAIEPDLLVLEQEGDRAGQELVNRVFRAIHSIKGASGFFGLEALKNLSHSMEGVLMMIRDGNLSPTPDVMDPLLAGIDKLNLMLDDIHASEDVPCEDEINILESILNEILAVSNDPVIMKTAEEEVSQHTPFQIDRFSLENALKNGQYLFSIKISFERDLLHKSLSPLDLLEQFSSLGMVLDTVFDVSEFPDLTKCLDASMSMKILIATVLEKDLLIDAIDIEEKDIKRIDPGELVNISIEPSEVEVEKEDQQDNLCEQEDNEIEDDLTMKESDLLTQEALQTELKAKQTGSLGDTNETIRVRVDLLNSLMDLAGEMVLSRNQLLRALDQEIYKNNSIANIIQNVDLITSDLQEHIMQTRMQPVGSIFGKFPRIVRDMARHLGKEIELITIGEDVELDKTILETLSDPLTHLIRNCCDHAIEPTEERSKAGKPQKGIIHLKAFHEGGQINIAITDDGRGIDHSKISKKAISQGLITDTEMRRMTPQEMVNLIFLPGLTTAEKVSDLSGRGVGMDVVKTNIEKVGGHISIETALGQGTTILLRLPLTLAIIPSLVVGVSGQRFAVPQVNLVELVCVKASEIASRVEKVGGATVLRLRGKLLPLVRLADVLGLERMFFHKESGEFRPDRRKEIADLRNENNFEVKNAKEDESSNRRTTWHSDYNVLVLKIGNSHFGLIVDELFDMEEIVVKPLAGFIKGCKCFAGSTIMGDGRVAMILDAGGILSFSKLSFAEISAEEKRRETERIRTEVDREEQAIILFNNALDEIFSLPLDAVLRLEKFDTARIEHISGREFITYENKSLLLIRLANYLPVSPMPDDLKEAFLIIPRAGNGTAGIIVSRILDSLETEIKLEDSLLKQQGVKGSIIVNNHLALYLDPAELLELAGISMARTDFAGINV